MDIGSNGPIMKKWLNENGPKFCNTFHTLIFINPKPMIIQRTYNKTLIKTKYEAFAILTCWVENKRTSMILRE